MMSLCLGGTAAPAHWNEIVLRNDTRLDGTSAYHFSGDIYGSHGEYAWIFSHMYGHMEDAGYRLKHMDFSSESMDPTFNWWVLACYGDIVGEESFKKLTPIEDFYDDSYGSGGTLIENPSDFYMVFKASEVLLEDREYVAGQSWYGWVHVSIDENLDMTLLEDEINLDGGPVTVGIYESGIPEPSSALLLLVGGALLALVRRFHETTEGDRTP